MSGCCYWLWKKETSFRMRLFFRTIEPFLFDLNHAANYASSATCIKYGFWKMKKNSKFDFGMKRLSFTVLPKMCSSIRLENKFKLNNVQRLSISFSFFGEQMTTVSFKMDTGPFFQVLKIDENEQKHAARSWHYHLSTWSQNIQDWWLRWLIDWLSW